MFRMLVNRKNLTYQKYLSYTYFVPYIKYYTPCVNATELAVGISWHAGGSTHIFQFQTHYYTRGGCYRLVTDK